MKKVSKRKIVIVTGSRADYGYLKPLIEEVKKEKKLHLRLYVSGMHLSKSYGETIKEIIKDGFKVARKINMEIKSNNTPYDLANSIAVGIKRFANALRSDKPDIVVVFGDRIEPFAAAIAATALNIPIAHINGGDVALGDIDDNLRHAITKLSHLHFPSTRKSAERILKLGEEKWRVFEVGALTLDTIFQKKLLSKEQIFKKYHINNDSIILISYQPSTTEWSELGNQMSLILEAVEVVIKKRKGTGIVIIHPNNYPGRELILKVIKHYQQKLNSIFTFCNLPHHDYLSLMASSSVFIGNSSSGIIEAPSLGIPFISIGVRQQGREKAKNVIEVGYNKKAIINAINKALNDKKFLEIVRQCKTPYGKGKASKKIVSILKKIKLDKKLLQKKITY